MRSAAASEPELTVRRMQAIDEARTALASNVAPLVALEAMACELPVLASNVGGLPEIIDDGVGGLFDPGNPKALARAVIEILAAGNLPELGRAARSRVKELWSNDRLADRHLEIYSDLLEMRGRV